MSFSFSIRGADKAAAKAAAQVEMDRVVAGQPAHARDRDAALANVGNAIDILADDPTKDVSASVNGWVSWQHGQNHDDADLTITGCAIQCSAGLAERPVEAAPESSGPVSA